uniref:basic proline-rich protein-like n=1 Tax=Agelaius phoeniceus TaxID=39638 RepID=UPI0023EDFCCF|nr:basic proline-rich protein-like [Agelaius phoeniceus]
MGHSRAVGQQRDEGRRRRRRDPGPPPAAGTKPPGRKKPPRRSATSAITVSTRAVPSTPGAAAPRPQCLLCAVPREALPPPPPGVPSARSAPRAAHAPVPAGVWAQSPGPGTARLALGPERPSPPTTPCRRRGVCTGGCSLCRACCRSSPASAVPAAAQAQPLPCLLPLKPSLPSAPPLPAGPAATPAPSGRTPRPSRRPAHRSPWPPRSTSRRPHAAPPATPGSSPADEPAPPPPVVAFWLLPPPLHGGPSRAFPSTASRLRAAGCRGSAASCSHGRPGVRSRSRGSVPAAPPAPPTQPSFRDQPHACAVLSPRPPPPPPLAPPPLANRARETGRERPFQGCWAAEG